MMIPGELHVNDLFPIQICHKLLYPLLLRPVFPPNKDLAEVDCRLDPFNFLSEQRVIPDVVHDDKTLQVGQRWLLDVTRLRIGERGKRITEHADVCGRADARDDEEVGRADETEGLDLSYFVSLVAWDSINQCYSS